MSAFWSGFEKRAYTSDVGEIKKNYEKRSKGAPASKLQSGLIGAGTGALMGAAVGAMRRKSIAKPALLGAGIMGGLGVLSAAEDKRQIEIAKKVLAMPPAEQKKHFKHIADKNALAESWSSEYGDRRRSGV